MVINERDSAYKIAICDDEKICIQNLLEELYKTKYEFEVSVFTSGEELLNSHEEFQVVFLDVVMGGINGYQVAQQLRKGGFRGFIIFLTSYIDNFTEAFCVKSFRYLLKPLQREKLLEALEGVEKELEESRKIYVEYKGKNTFIKCNEIVCIKACKDESVVYDIWGREHISNKRIGLWKDMLPSQSFFQVHRSYLIAIRYVVGLPKSGYISMKGMDGLIPVSKRLVVEFKKTLLEYVRMRSGNIV